MSRTGWCLTKDCDTEDKRGGCPVVAGANPPCQCTCHGGSSEARPYLPVVPRFAATGEEAALPDDTDGSAGP